MYGNLSQIIATMLCDLSSDEQIRQSFVEIYLDQDTFSNLFMYQNIDNILETCEIPSRWSVWHAACSAGFLWMVLTYQWAYE